MTKRGGGNPHPLGDYLHGQFPLKQSAKWEPWKAVFWVLTDAPWHGWRAHFSLLHSGLLEVSPRTLFSKPWRGSREVVSGSLDSLGYLPKGLRRSKFKEEKQYHVVTYIPTPPYPKVCVRWGKYNLLALIHSRPIRLRHDHQHPDWHSFTTTFRAQLSIWGLMAQTNQEKQS